MIALQPVFIFAFFAFLFESLAEYFVTPWFDDPLVWRPLVLRWVIAALSIFACFFLALNLLDLIGFRPVNPYIGYILTGLVLSRGANYLNDIITAFQGGALRITGPSATVNTLVGLQTPAPKP